MKFNTKTLIIGMFLVLAFSCESKTTEFNSEYLIGEWNISKVIEKTNGKEIENPKLNAPIKYEFKKNGTIVLGDNNIENGKWEITKDKTIKMGSEDVFWEYTPEIESYDKMKLHLNFENKLMTSYYERNYSE